MLVQLLGLLLNQTVVLCYIEMVQGFDVALIQGGQQRALVDHLVEDLLVPIAVLLINAPPDALHQLVGYLLIRQVVIDVSVELLELADVLVDVVLLLLLLPLLHLLPDLLNLPILALQALLHPPHPLAVLLLLFTLESLQLLVHPTQFYPLTIEPLYLSSAQPPSIPPSPSTP